MNFIGNTLFVLNRHAELKIEIPSKKTSLRKCPFEAQKMKCSEKVLIGSTINNRTLHFKDMKNVQAAWVSHQFPLAVTSYSVCFNESHNKTAILCHNGDEDGYFINIYDTDEQLKLDPASPFISFKLDKHMRGLKSIEWKHGFIWLCTLRYGKPSLQHPEAEITHQDLYRLQII